MLISHKYIYTYIKLMKIIIISLGFGSESKVREKKNPRFNGNFETTSTTSTTT